MNPLVFCLVLALPQSTVPSDPPAFLPAPITRNPQGLLVNQKPAPIPSNIPDPIADLAPPANGPSSSFTQSINSDSSNSDASLGIDIPENPINQVPEPVAPGPVVLPSSTKTLTSATAKATHA